MRNEVTYELTYTQDDSPVRGNAMVSGDADQDREVENQIIADLNRGNEYAWAQVKVSARCGRFYGAAYLGACSYNSEKDLIADLLTEDSHGLKAEALADLLMGLKDKKIEGENAAELYRELTKGEA